MTLAAVLTACATPAFAQNPPPQDSPAIMRIGPLALRSTLALSNLGIDRNVFNESDADDPESDFTATFSPTTDLWLRMGRTWVTGTIRVDWHYYNRFVSERGANSSYRVGWFAPFNRLTIRTNAMHLSARDRPALEIDVRVPRNEDTFDGEIEVRTFPKTYISVKALRRTIDFHDAAVFLDASLPLELNRTTAATALVVRHQLTPLTALLLEMGRDRDRFEFSPRRDANSTRIAGGVSFDPRALISGSALVGYRAFKPIFGDVQPYRGTTATAGLSYTAFGTTRLGLQVARDVQHSFEFDQPYYVQTDVIGSVQRQLVGPWDILARAGVQRFAYRDRIGVTVEAPNRTDSIRSYGGGVGYRLGRDTRIGFNIDRQRRTSDVAGRQYRNLRFGTSLTHGI